MAEDMLIRKENLCRLAKSPGDLVARLGRSYSFWRDLMRDPKKAFGEKIARDIEDGWPLPRYWLDQVHGDEDPIPGSSRPLDMGVDAGYIAVPLYASLPLSWMQLMSEDRKGALKGRFTAEVSDDAMAPLARKGEVHFFDCDVQPMFGAGVIVRDGDGGLHLRQYRQGARPGQWHGHAMNPSYRTLDSQAEALAIVAVLRLPERGWEDL